MDTDTSTEIRTIWGGKITKCRACLTEDVPLVHLFETFEHNLTLANILQTCVNDEVNKLLP